jgi:hypothetical protein
MGGCQGQSKIASADGVECFARKVRGDRTVVIAVRSNDESPMAEGRGHRGSSWNLRQYRGGVARIQLDDSQLKFIADRDHCHDDLGVTGPPAPAHIGPSFVSRADAAGTVKYP